MGEVLSDKIEYQNYPRLIVKPGESKVVQLMEKKLVKDGKAYVCTVETVDDAQTYEFWANFDEKGRNYNFTGLKKAEINDILLIGKAEKAGNPHGVWLPMERMVLEEYLKMKDGK